jgi:MFS family permease
MQRLAILLAAMGYFVDIYDLLLFSIVRVPSLASLGYQGQSLTDSGILLLNVQMAGLLAGGICWGVLADKRGRLQVLFGSILLYSIANLANGFVHSMQGYIVWRFLAGFGLAGELGAGITLVSEIMPAEKRGYGTTLVAAVGVSGAVAGFFIAELFNWRTCFWIGGGMGLLLLLLRIGVMESGMFEKTRRRSGSRGNFLSLFSSRERFFKYLQTITIGVPLWFVVGILITLSPEFGRALGVHGNINGGAAVAFCYAGLVAGDIISGLLSQRLKSRVRVVRIFLFSSVLAMSIYFCLRGAGLFAFYAVCLLLGVSVGYWVVFVTIAAEQFGTNLRATVTTTAPNFVRGALVPVSLLFQSIRSAFKGAILPAAIIVAAICLALAFWALRNLQETYGKELDYTE